MITHHEIAKVLVEARQETLRREARRWRLASLVRRRRRASKLRTMAADPPASQGPTRAEPVAGSPPAESLAKAA